MHYVFFFVLTTFFSNNQTRYMYADSTLLKDKFAIAHSFNSVRINNDMKVFISEGDKNEIILVNKEAADKVKYLVKDEVLIVKSKLSLFKTHMPVIIIKVKSISAITINGIAEVRTLGDISCERLNLAIDGDGAIHASTNAIEVKTSIHGSGKIEVKGNFKYTAVNKDAWGNMVTIYN